MPIRFVQGDTRDVLPTLESGSVDCIVTSPPYFGLRDYGTGGQIGLEPTPAEFVAELVAVFREARRVLKDDGTLWLNLGDSYNSGPSGSLAGSTLGGGQANQAASNRSDGRKAQWREGSARADGNVRDDGASRRNRNGTVALGMKHKDLIGIPWRVAFALQADGWYLRQDIIWSKPNPMPESVTDRCTKAHEYLFLLSKSSRYYFDAKAISEAVAPSTVGLLAQNVEAQAGSARVPGKTNGAMKAKAPRFGGQKYGDDDREESRTKSGNDYALGDGTRNRRSVWTVATQPFKEAHFATFPPALIEPCILAGCPVGGTVLDPFGGAGTTGLVADRLQRNAVLIELNPEYLEIARRRIHGDAPLLAETAA